MTIADQLREALDSLGNTPDEVARRLEEAGVFRIMSELRMERDNAERRYGALKEAVRSFHKQSSIHNFDRMLRLAGIETEPYLPPRPQGDNPVA